MEHSENAHSSQELSAQTARSMTATSNSIVNRPVFMPETFTGSGRDWSDWSQQFEMAAEVNNWNGDLKLKFMSLLLSGRARDVFCGLTIEDRSSYAKLKEALSKCFDPCESEDWNRASLSARRRLPGESAREFGNALRRLVAKSYPVANCDTQDLLAREQFIAHVGTGELRIQLRSARPATLEAAINLASELELIRELERSQITPEMKVRGVSNNNPNDTQMAILLETVESLRQEVRTLQVTVQNLTKTQVNNASSFRAPSHLELQGFNRGQKGRGDVCWECGCDRHLRKACPYVQGK